MRTFLLAFASLALVGCDNFADYFSTTAAEAMLIGVDELPGGIEIGAPAESTVFVAQARSLTRFAANLVDDADSVSLEVGSDSFELSNQDTGVYAVTTLDDPSFEYVPGATYELVIEEGGKVRRASVEAPESPDLGDPEEPVSHSAGDPLEFDLSDQGFDNYVAVVARVAVDGELTLTFDSRPTTAQDYIDWIGPGGSDVGVIAIPGSAFPDDAASYVVGIAGMRKAPQSVFERLNPAISNLVAGSLAGRPVVTVP